MGKGDAERGRHRRCDSEPLPRSRLRRACECAQRSAGNCTVRSRPGRKIARRKHLKAEPRAASLGHGGRFLPRPFCIDIQGGTKVRKPKGVVLKGVRFRPGEVDWEDAFSSSREKLPDFDAMRQRGQYIGKKVTTLGLVARIGNYLLVIQERDEEQEEFDYTVIPLRAKTEVRYT